MGTPQIHTGGPLQGRNRPRNNLATEPRDLRRGSMKKVAAPVRTPQVPFPLSHFSGQSVGLSTQRARVRTPQVRFLCHKSRNRSRSYRIGSYRIAPYRIGSYRIVSYRIESYQIVSCRIVPHLSVPAAGLFLFGACGGLMGSAQ